jgi:hypothetical protein
MIVKLEMQIPPQTKHPYDEEFFLIWKEALLFITKTFAPTKWPIKWSAIGYGIAYIELPEIDRDRGFALLGKFTAMLNKKAPKYYPLLEPSVFGFSEFDRAGCTMDITQKSKALYELYVENELKQDTLFPHIDVLPYDRMPAIFREGLIIE